MPLVAAGGTLSERKARKKGDSKSEISQDIAKYHLGLDDAKGMSGKPFQEVQQWFLEKHGLSISRNVFYNATNQGDDLDKPDDDFQCLASYAVEVCLHAHIYTHTYMHTPHTCFLCSEHCTHHTHTHIV
jgi:hypothetical protein